MGEAVRTRVDVEVRYFETDQMGVVHHANYLVWFELARTDLCARSGYHYADIERLGYRLMNSELQVRYRKPARYGETVGVTCWIEHLASPKFNKSIRSGRPPHHRDNPDGSPAGRLDHLPANPFLHIRCSF